MQRYYVVIHVHIHMYVLARKFETDLGANLLNGW